MTDETQVNTRKDIFSLGLYQIFVTLVCQVVLFILLQLTIAPIVVFDKLPDEFWDMSESARLEVQKEIMESVQSIAKESPEQITKTYNSILIQKTPSLFLLNNFLWFFGFVITGYVLFSWRNVLSLPDFNAPLSSTEIFKGFLLGFLLYFLISSSSLLFYFLEYKPEMGEFQKTLFRELKDNNYLLAWSIYTVGLITGIIEEVYFRGFLLTQFMSNGYGKFGLLFTSILFGILHYSGEASPLVPVFITFVGYILGRSYLVTGNIWISMMGHAVYNTLGLVTAYMVGDKI